MRRIAIIGMLTFIVGCGGDDKEPRAIALDSPYTCVAGINIKAGEDPGPALNQAKKECANRPRPAPLPTARAGTAAERGRNLVASNGCQSCHLIGAAGNDGPGPDLTHVAKDLPPPAILRAMVDPVLPMPPYARLGIPRLRDIVAYLESVSARD